MSDAAIGGKLSGSSFIGWAVALFKSPRSFFRGMDKQGGYIAPILYLLGWSVVSGLIGFLVSLGKPAPAVGGRGVQALAVFLGPVLVVAFGFVVAGVLFVIWHLMGSKEDYQAAFRVWAFMAPVGAVMSILGILPPLPVLALIYTLYLLVVASQEAHGLSSKRSWGVWGALGGLFALLMAAAMMATMAARRSGGFAGPRGPVFNSPVQR